MFGASKPVVSTLAFVSAWIFPALNSDKMRSRSFFGVSPVTHSATMPRAHKASATFCACLTPAQNSSQLFRPPAQAMISSTTAVLFASVSKASCISDSINSPPRLCSPAVSSLASVGRLRSFDKKPLYTSSSMLTGETSASNRAGLSVIMP